MKIVVSIHDLPVWSIPDAEIDRVSAALPDDEVVSAREADARRREFPMADVLFATKIRSEEFVAAPNVRWMHSSAVGVGPLLPREVVESSVVVSNSKGVHSEAIAEHAVALLLALRRGLHTARDRQHDAVWAQEELQARRVPVAEATEVLVVGLGSIGAPNRHDVRRLGDARDGRPSGFGEIRAALHEECAAAQPPARRAREC